MSGFTRDCHYFLQMSDLGRIYLGLSAHYVCGAGAGVDCGGVVVAVVEFVTHIDFDLK